MKSRLTLIMAFAFTIGAFFAIPWLLPINVTKTNAKIRVISHRGAANLAPENTIKSIEKAIELKVDKIEVDIHQTSDNVLVVIHDEKVDRTTNGRGLIKDLNFKTIKELKIEHEFKDIGNLKVPSLDEVFTIIKKSTSNLIIEVKNPESYPDLATNLRDLINKHTIQDQVEIFSFDKNFIKIFKKDNPNIKVGYFVIFPYGTNNINDVDAVGIYYPGLIYKKSFIDLLHKKGIKVYAWTVNSEKNMHRFIEMKVDGITTDSPDKLISALK